MEAGDVLRQEREYYQGHKAELLEKYVGKFALIKGQRLLGIFDSQATAYAEGLRLVGNVPMLVVGVQKDEPLVWFPALQLGLISASIQS